MFKDRIDAGRKLARQLKPTIKDKQNTVILGLLRGGFVVAKQIGKDLHLPAYGLLVKKIRHPTHPEFAVGAVCEQHVYWSIPGMPDHLKDQLLNKTLSEIKEITAKYKDKIKLPNLTNKQIILTDDGAATGSTILAALLFLKNQAVKNVVIALPVAPFDAKLKIENFADDISLPAKVVCLDCPKEGFFAVSAYYQSFPEVQWRDIIENKNRVK
ncbi:MAG: hypothetical protein GXP43_03605 [bacterium]|nr:hypothetical protein [bacterium]